MLSNIWRASCNILTILLRRRKEYPIIVAGLEIGRIVIKLIGKSPNGDKVADVHGTKFDGHALKYFLGPGMGNTTVKIYQDTLDKIHKETGVQVLQSITKQKEHTYNLSKLLQQGGFKLVGMHKNKPIFRRRIDNINKGDANG